MTDVAAGLEKTGYRYQCVTRWYMCFIAELAPRSKHSVRCFRYAAGLARDHGARMHVLQPVSTTVDIDITAARLRQMADAHDFDLIVVSMGRRAHASSKRALGNMLQRVFNGADCPVIVVGPAVNVGVPPRSEPATILHATDFSPHALAAAQHAFSWAQECQSWITLLHVVQGLDESTASDRERLGKPFRAWIEELLPAELPIWCEVEHRVEFGSPGEKIVNAAEELHADLLVVGLTGMDAITQDSPGATALEVITRAPCPVLVVRNYMKKRATRPIPRDARSRLVAAAA
jgi:nucleotide-binding universal stress UspA family protein